MKKLLLFALGLFASVGAMAQITLTQSSVGAVGSTFVLGVDTIIPPGYSIGAPGTNQTWDFSQLNQDYYDTIWFVDPNSTPNASDFPSATHAVAQATTPGGYAYLESTSSALYMLGFGGDHFGFGTPIVAYQDPPLQMAAFPFTYGDNLRDTSTLSATFDGSGFGFPGVDSARYTSEAIRYVEADAWGTLTLWGGTYAALRTKEIRTTHDVVEVRVFGFWTPFQDTTYTDSTFTWWNDTKGYSLAAARYFAGVLEEIEYQDPNPVGIANGIANAVTVYPNPAEGRFVVASEAVPAAVVCLYDLQGRLLAETAATGTRTEVPLDGIAPGMVIYRVRDAVGATIGAGKLIVR